MNIDTQLQSLFKSYLPAVEPSADTISHAMSRVKAELARSRAEVTFTQEIADAATDAIQPVIDWLARRYSSADSVAPAPRQPYAVARIENGDAIIKRRAKTYAVQKSRYIAIHEGDEIITQNVKASMQLFNGQTLEIAQSSRARLEQFTKDINNKLVNIAVSIGRVSARITEPLQGGDLFAIATPTAVAMARGTQFSVEVLASAESVFMTTEGVISVKQGDDEVRVEAGEEVRAQVGQPMLVKQSAPKSVPDFHVYVIQVGDTFTSVAAKYNVSERVLRAANPSVMMLKVGALLVVPQPRR
jgi:LysM repeat protein